MLCSIPWNFIKELAVLSGSIVWMTYWRNGGEDTSDDTRI